MGSRAHPDPPRAGARLGEDLPERLRGLPPAIPPPGAGGERLTLAEVERRYASQIAETGGNKTRAAEIRGIDRKTLYRILGEKDGG